MDKENKDRMHGQEFGEQGLLGSTSPEVRPENERSPIEEFIGSRFKHREVPQQDHPFVSWKQDPDGVNVLLFGTKTVNREELLVIEGYLRAHADNRDLGHYLREEPEALINVLMEAFRERKAELFRLLGPDSETSEPVEQTILENKDFPAEVLGKVKLMIEASREMGQKEMVRRTIRNQMKFLPFSELVLGNGKEVSFSSENVAGTAVLPGEVTKELEWLYVANPTDNLPELVISSPEGINVVYTFGDNDTLSGLNRFLITELESKNDANADFVFVLEQGGADDVPIFSRVRIVKRPLDVEKEMKKVLRKEKAKVEESVLEEELEKIRRAYKAPSPSISSGSRSSRSSSSYENRSSYSGG